MSEGPIHQWWKSHAPAKMTTSPASSMHMSAARLDDRDRAYCGRKVPAVSRTADEALVTCANCRAALIADALGES